MKQIFHIFFKIDLLLAKIEKACLLISFFTLFAFAALQIILRNTQDLLNQTFAEAGSQVLVPFLGAWAEIKPIGWGDVFNRLMVLWVCFFAAVIGAKKCQHLSLEVITKFLPAKAKSFIGLVVNAYVVFVTGVLSKVSWEFFADQMQYEITDELFPGVPKAVFSIIFPIGFGLLSFHYVTKFIEELYRISGFDEAELKSYNEV